VRQIISRLPIQWRVFVGSSITITILFALAGWGLQRYALGVADESVGAELRVSVRVYEALWATRTRLLSATTALIAAMSDVRGAFETRDEKTIRDSIGDLWSRVSDQSAVFLVLGGDGRLIASLGANPDGLSASQIPLQGLVPRFSKQVAGYIRQQDKLFYIVLTPVYVQATTEPVLLNVLCAGFRIDNRLVGELHQLAPGSEYAFLDGHHVFASTLTGNHEMARLLQIPAAEGKQVQQNDFVVSTQNLNDVNGRPVAQLRIFHSYANLERSLSGLRKSLGLAWLATIATALLVSSFLTRRLLQPVKLLDRAASEVAARNYHFRLAVHGDDELSRLAATFNQMCDSIERAQAELIRQEQIHTIGRLATSLVHDLRNPLAAIYGGAEMLVDGDLPSEQTRRIASNIYRASHRLQELLKNLLSVSRGETTEPETCRLRDIVEAAAESIQPGSGIRIQIAIDEATELCVERIRLERVFVNLFCNAVEAMPDGGAIYVYSKEDNANVIVFVEDTGPGVPASVRSNLFQPFVTAGKRTGLGLGLPLARQTMLDVGGDLQLVNRTGAGACFYLRFPKRPTCPDSPQESITAGNSYA
jgi:signal transduction histidine kinase